MADPPMSSIDPDGAQMGYAAAGWLDRLMAGGAPPARGVCVPPRGLVVRRSSDVLAVEDAEVAAALRLIRRRACAGLRVADVAREAAVSRSVLERKFRRWLGRTPKDEIVRVQMEQARELLLGSEAPLREVARRSGFSSEKYFSDAFHRQTGVRPGAFRRRQRGADL
jgi:LacI family transcriptional regulator